MEKTLSRLVGVGMIRRLRQGIYEYPRKDREQGGLMAPDYDRVAKAIARKNGWRIHADGAMAANLLGLTPDAPAQTIYLTDGPSSSIAIADQTIHFKHAAPRKMRVKNRRRALVLQAIRHLGREGVDDETIEAVRQHLTPKDRRRLLKEARYAIDWIYEVVRRIAEL